MTQSYLNRWGVRYYLPDFGPPVRWIASVPDFDSSDLPTLLYYECDAENLGMRAMHLYADGRVILAYPGGPDGDSLPEGALGSVEDYAKLERGESREISELEFNTMWAALTRATDQSQAKPLVDLTSSADPATFEPFVGTWIPEAQSGGLPNSIFLSANGLVVWNTDRSEVDVFKYRAEGNVAILSDSTGDKGEFEIVESYLVLRMAGHEVGHFVRTE